MTVIAAVSVCGCIKNDIPYPRIQANFVTFVAENQSRDAAIDSINRMVTLYFGETVDIENVHVRDYSVTPGSELVGINLYQPLNLTVPLNVELKLYQSWIWRITAVQEIERYFSLSGQVGTSVIDVPGRRVVAYVSKKTPLASVLVEKIKLGPEGCTMSPDITGKRIDFTHPVDIEVVAFGRSEVWTLYVDQTDSDVETVQADAWTNVAWVYGQGQVGRDNGIEYRLKGADEWIRVPESDLTFNGGSFYARISHLTAQTTYEARAYSGDAYGAVVEFTTGIALQVPNMSLDEWWLDGKVWNPWKEGDEPYWDTGNKGATTIGSSNSVPTEETSTGSGWAAMLETKFVGIGALGKLAAGNLFAGRYVKTDGTNGILSFGRPFAERPTGLRGQFKYVTAPINYTSSGFEKLAGQPDTCIVWVALIDSDEPFEIRTNPKNRQLFDRTAPSVIAYGQMQCGETTSGYTSFKFNLEYVSTSRVPKYILITASASKYGDYFTGGGGAVLYLDELELLYDY